jgi:hypothetical protein
MPGGSLFAGGRQAAALSFRGSRSDLEQVTAQRLQAAFVLVFLATRFVHLSQAGVDLVLAGGTYTREGLAWCLGVACALESVVVAAVFLRARRLTPVALVADAVFGAAGLAVMSAAMTATPLRTGSLNWMLPYTVATAAGLGVVGLGASAPGHVLTGPLESVPGRRFRRSLATIIRRVWPTVLVVALAGVYVASVYRPHRLPDDRPSDIWGNAANYLAFFVAAVSATLAVRRLLKILTSRNAEVTRQAALVAEEAQWRAVAVDVFGPVVDLLDRVAVLDGQEVPAELRLEADRLVAMIEAVRPADGDGAGGWGFGDGDR